MSRFGGDPNRDPDPWNFERNFDHLSESLRSRCFKFCVTDVSFKC